MNTCTRELIIALRKAAYWGKKQNNYCFFKGNCVIPFYFYKKRCNILLNHWEYKAALSYLFFLTKSNLTRITHLIFWLVSDAKKGNIQCYFLNIFPNGQTFHSKVDSRWKTIFFYCKTRENFFVHVVTLKSVHTPEFRSLLQYAISKHFVTCAV